MNKKSLTRLALGGIMAGGMLLTGCENSAEPAPAATSTKSILNAKTLADFTRECQAIAGTVEPHSCQGGGTCKGYSFKDGLVAEHTCKGVSSCNGANCKETTAK